MPTLPSSQKSDSLRLQMLSTSMWIHKTETSPDSISRWSNPISLINHANALRPYMLHNGLINRPRDIRLFTWDLGWLCLLACCSNHISGSSSIHYQFLWGLGEFHLYFKKLWEVKFCVKCISYIGGPFRHKMTLVSIIIASERRTLLKLVILRLHFMQLFI